MIEALTEPKTWLFALFSALDNVPNGLTNQRQIIVSSFGFSTLQTTLLGCVDGVVEITTIWTGVRIAARYDSRAYVAFAYFIPNVLGTILVNALPWSDKAGLLFSVWLTGVGTTGFVISLAWVSAVTAAHTGHVTTNTIMFSAYVRPPLTPLPLPPRSSHVSTSLATPCIGNCAGPFMWQAKHKPRNRVPWTVIGICYACCMRLMLAIRLHLARENRRRDAEHGYDDVFVERPAADSGKVERVRVDKEFLDLTDRQNRDLRYVL
ncbi:hypothetical protein B0H10DRAFT_523055 [Mycena sp. CBHHK59/15]|nr:hypothetical protein B0H10DRAFT_523055 [Mycena sp. CBHHK59/15]